MESVQQDWQENNRMSQLTWAKLQDVNIWYFLKIIYYMERISEIFILKI